MYPGPKGTAGGLTAGGLAATGSNLVWWLALGLAILIVGLLLVHATRRRLRTRSGTPGQDG